jgi:hypothetical protein
MGLRTKSFDLKDGKALDNPLKYCIIHGNWNHSGVLMTEKRIVPADFSIMKAHIQTQLVKSKQPRTFQVGTGRQTKSVFRKDKTCSAGQEQGFPVWKII